MQNALGHTGATTFTFASRNTWNVQYMAEQPVGCKTNGTMTFTFASCSTWTAEPPSTVRGATCGMMELFLDWTFPWLNNSLTELFLDWTFDLFHEWTFSLVLKLHNSELYSELPFMIAMWLCTFQITSSHWARANWHLLQPYHGKLTFNAWPWMMHILRELPIFCWQYPLLWEYSRLCLWHWSTQLASPMLNNVEQILSRLLAQRAYLCDRVHAITPLNWNWLVPFTYGMVGAMIQSNIFSSFLRCFFMFFHLSEFEEPIPHCPRLMRCFDVFWCFSRQSNSPCS